MIKNIDWMQHASSRLEHINQLNLIQEPFSEDQILFLQDKFLINGFHYLKFDNVFKGRMITEAIITSLGLYNDIALLSIKPILPQIHKVTVIDLYYELSESGYFNHLEPLSLDEFFMDHFYHDLMWIEATKEMLCKPWFDDIQKKIVDIEIHQHIPILITLYQNE